jgi:hypothetical protein
MKMIGILAVVVGCRSHALSLAPITCNSAMADTVSWRRIDTGPYSLLVPPGYNLTSDFGIDSHVRMWKAGDHRSIHADYGRGSDISYRATVPGYSVCRREIGGLAALVISGRDTERVFFSPGAPYFVLAQWPAVNLTIIAGTIDPGDQRALLTTVSSIRFHR